MIIYPLFSHKYYIQGNRDVQTKADGLVRAC